MKCFEFQTRFPIQSIYPSNLSIYLSNLSIYLLNTIDPSSRSYLGTRTGESDCQWVGDTSSAVGLVSPLLIVLSEVLVYKEDLLTTLLAQRTAIVEAPLASITR